MEKLRLKNYRCLEDTKDISLKPLTLLLGKNSSGKSSFLKFFPLLKQSVGSKINGVFLWDGQYVDFKNFKNTAYNNRGNIEVEYTIEEFVPFEDADDIKLPNVHVLIELSEHHETHDYLKKVEIGYDNVKATYIFDNTRNTCKVSVNSVTSTQMRDTIRFDNKLSLLPHLSFILKVSSYFRRSDVSLNAIKKVDTQLQTGMSVETYANPLMYVFTPEDVISMLQKENKKIKEEDITTDIIDTILYSNAIILYGAVNSYFLRMSYNTIYIGPLRSNMERYYRLQNKSTTEIDPSGDNLALYFYSLSPNKMESFNQWLYENFAFKVHINPIPGHVEIQVSKESEINLVDVGFGYTQILPILTIVWDAINNNKPRDSFPYKIIAIEQPELHLHPDFQKKFIDMIVSVIKHYGDKIHFIIETHSAYMLEKLESLSQNDMVNSTDVNFVLFNAANASNSEYIHQVTFGSDKLLHEWPAGFNHITNY